MDIKFSNVDDFLIVELIGELDHHSAEEVRVKIDDRIDRDNIKKVILNFRNVTFMDSSGIGIIMGRYKTVSLIGGEVWAVHTNERIRKILIFSGAAKIMQIYEGEK